MLGARLWWGDTPVDVFLNTTAYHEQVATRCRREWFSGDVAAVLAEHLGPDDDRISRLRSLG